MSSLSLPHALKYVLALAIAGVCGRRLVAWLLAFSRRARRGGLNTGKPGQHRQAGIADVSAPEDPASWAVALSKKLGRPEFAGLSRQCLDQLRKGLDSFAATGSGVGPNLCAVIVDGAIPFLHRSGCDWVEDSLFRMYSMTKPIVAVAFLTLVEQRLISLDDPIGTYLPCFNDVRVLSLRSRQRAELSEQVQRLLFDSRRSFKAHAAAKSRGALREDGWMKVSFILASPSLQKIGLSERVAVDMLQGVAALEVQVGGDGRAWVRRRGQEEWAGFADEHDDGEAPRRAITLRMLLTHTAGFGYDFSLYREPPTVVQRAYGQLARDVEKGSVPDLDAWVERLARIPLLFHPGEEFKYGYSFDVLGRVAEVVAGMPLDQFLHRTVLGPLKMHDTGFAVPLSKVSRLVPLRRHRHCVMKEAVTGPSLDDGCRSSRWAEANRSPVLSGGGAVEAVAGGLVGTLHDYVLFLEMLLRRGTTADGGRVLAARTVEMAFDGRQLSLATEGRLRESMPGRSFGFLGEVVGPRSAASGLVSWGGTAGTYFGVHLQQSYAVAFFAQSFGAPKVKAFFEDNLCPEFE